MAQSITEGVRYTWNDTTLFLLVLIALVPTFLGQPYMALLTVFAQDVFQVGPEGLGLLSSCAAAGSVAGGIMLASMPAWASSSRAMLIFLILFGVSLTSFAVSQTLYLAVPLLFAVGAMHIACNAANTTLLQLSSPAHMRGRILSIMLLNRGLTQLGVAVLAALSGIFGVQAAVGSAGIVILALGVVAFVKSRLGNPSVSDVAGE